MGSTRVVFLQDKKKKIVKTMYDGTVLNLKRYGEKQEYDVMRFLICMFDCNDSVATPNK